MKYIRTKDGVYDKNSYKLNIAISKEIRTTRKIDYTIIKQADTIEELCDEFLLFREGKPYAIVPNKEHNAELAKAVWKDYRGAIWTDKGLIYVAKVNDKGELELL